MNFILFISSLICSFTPLSPAFAQSSFIDRDFTYKFEPFPKQHNTHVLIDSYHRTIYRGNNHANHDLGIIDILQDDGFATDFLAESITAASLKETSILAIFGMQGRSTLVDGQRKIISSLKEDETDYLTSWVNSGGSLLLIVGHFPNGQGAIPLIERFGVDYRNGYANYPGLPGEKQDDLCSHFTMTRENQLISDHSITTLHQLNLSIDAIHFLCGSSVSRNSGDVVIALPKDTRIYYRDNTTSKLEERERGDNYAAMIAFEFGKGRVAIAGDRGIFRHLIKTFNGQQVPVTMNSPDNQNAALFVNTMRWLARIN